MNMDRPGFLTLVMIVLLPCSHPQLVNVARSKPTFQSTGLKTAYSSRAVDGNKNLHFSAGKSCSCTSITDGGTTNPWWAVDLQWSRLVDRVDLTNRGDCCATRLSNVRIGTTDVSPAVTAPTLTNIRICASKDPPVGSGATEQFPCGEQGRYLVVLLEGTKKILTLCEVEVFAPRISLKFAPTPNVRLVGHVISVTNNTESDLWCAMECLWTPQCSSINVMRTVGGGSVAVCELNADISEAQITANLTTDPDYVFYRIIAQL